MCQLCHSHCRVVLSLTLTSQSCDCVCHRVTKCVTVSGDGRGDAGAPVLRIWPGLVVLQSPANHAVLQPPVSPASSRWHLHLADAQGHGDTAIDDERPTSAERRRNDLSGGATQWRLVAAIGLRDDAEDLDGEADAKRRSRDASTRPNAKTVLVSARRHQIWQ